MNYSFQSGTWSIGFGPWESLLPSYPPDEIEMYQSEGVRRTCRPAGGEPGGAARAREGKGLLLGGRLHNWLDGRGPQFNLRGFLDDA
jgi:hypothetical protein